ncbi:MAG TPA: hypothetical protein VFH59_09700 [Frateuria sp.]|uniref:hypothetical protein n=1 Tax=Frateuria sp. TaxID=2211372 RepID=UPI002D801A44|nr:hypothetical protein [Frateuria sp.]HET6805700.1 hypothetical protein [Frateuria sp.]
MGLRPVHQRYLRRFLPAMAGYCALIALYGGLVPHTPSTALRALLALLPMLPIVLAMRAIALVIREQDELERLIDLQALAAAAVLTACGFLSLGLLISADVIGGMPAELVALLVLPCFFAAFGLAKLVVWLRLQRR